jgi:HAD superfamily hydrolase (TIGR01509 family)
MPDERPLPWRYRAVAFDLDGLLIDTEPIFSEAVRRYLDRRGLPFDSDFMHTMMGSPAAQSLPLFREYFRLTDPLDVIALECKTLFLDVLGDGPGPLMPGVAAALDRLLARGVPFCIATSSGSEFVRRVFGPHGLLDRFRFVLTCEDVTRGKPFPDVYELAARRFDVAVNELVVLEDSPLRCRSARAHPARPAARGRPDCHELGGCRAGRGPGLVTTLRWEPAYCNTPKVVAGGAAVVRCDETVRQPRQRTRSRTIDPAANAFPSTCPSSRTVTSVGPEP